MIEKVVEKGKDKIHYGAYIIKSDAEDNTFGYNIIVNTSSLHAAPSTTTWQGAGETTTAAASS